jgi:aspartyl-tRNA(Asn)/glutamyl-tRNA(Gln) amidotransferase subunit A
MLSTALNLVSKKSTASKLLSNILTHKVVTNGSNSAGVGSNGVVVLQSHGEQTFQQAAYVDQQLANNTSLPLLAGVPVSIKDNFNTIGLKTTAGSNILRHYDSEYDAEVVTRLRAQGAIICAKANLDEFGMGSSMINSAFGSCSSPWSKSEDGSNDPITPGGSSGASAVLVASNVVSVAIASDTGGSVRQPASYCGVVGLKPTYGALSRHGLIAYASSMDTPGIIAKNVIDTAIVFSALAGKDDKDPSSIATDHSQLISKLIGDNGSRSSSTTNKFDFKVSDPMTTDTIEELMKLASTTQPNSLQGMRVGIPHEFVLDEMDHSIRELWKSSAAHLEAAGAKLVTLSLPAYKLALPCYYVLACAEAASNLARYDGLRYGVNKTGDAQKYDSKTKADVKSSHSAQDFLHSVAANRGDLFGPEVIKRILTGTFVLTKGAIENFYGKAQTVRQLIVKETLNAFEQEVDVMLFPTSPKLPFHLSNPPQGIHMLLHDLFTVPANLTGCPAISVPVGTGHVDSSNNDSSSKGIKSEVPVGMQVMSMRNNELAMLKTALALEQRVQFHEKHRPPQSV